MNTAEKLAWLRRFSSLLIGTTCNAANIFSPQGRHTWSVEERSAMKERILELRANKADGEAAVLAKIEEMP